MGKKKISVGTWAYIWGGYADKPIPFPTVVKKLKELKFDGIEFGAFEPHLQPNTKEKRAEIKKMLDDAGLGISGVAHQNGTARFGTDPETSVLDVNCKLHDVDNTYVVDSSFFVSSTAVNPTLTIVANALRVADHLAERLGVAAVPTARQEPVTVR